MPQNPLCERSRSSPGPHSGFSGDIQHGLAWDRLKWGCYGGAVSSWQLRRVLGEKLPGPWGNQVRLGDAESVHT